MEGVFKSFVSEKEIEEVKQKRQEEWEKVRRPDQPLQRPEESYDHRTLYERLKVQKDKKQEEFLEQLKFKNMIYKGLDNEEATFLTFIAQRQAEQETEKIKQEIEEVHTFREAVAKLQDEQELSSMPQSSVSSSHNDPLTSSSTSSRGSTKPKQKSKQLALIAGSIKTKRKRSHSSPSGDRDATDKDSNSPASGEKTISESPEKKPKLDDEAVTGVPQPLSEETERSRNTSTSHALSGLSAYSSSSDSDSDT